MDIPYKDSKQPYTQKVTAKLRAAFAMGDSPTELLGAWQGYFRFMDPTRQNPNTLAFPSINCFIPKKDKIVPRLGSQLLGRSYTDGKNWPVVGHKKRFATMGGYEVEVRVTKSNDANLKDIIEVFYPNPATGVYQWYQITQNVNPLTPGVHRYYMDDWFDTNLNPAKSLNLSRLIWVNGLTQIFSWTGGIAPIVSIVPNVSITTTAGVAWASLGFVDPAIDASSSGRIIVNGLSYLITGGWATDTLTLGSTAGISVNDVAFMQIQTNTSTTAPNVPFDVCRSNDNYIYYGNWKSRKLYQSNGFGKDATMQITTSQAVQNDLVLGTSAYTGTGSHVYKVTIDSINVNEQSFSPGGSGNLNDGLYNTSAYNLGHLATPNVYKIVMRADMTVGIPSATLQFNPGQGITGGTSLASGVIVARVFSGVAGVDVIAVRLNTGSPAFISGETLTEGNTLVTAVAAGAFFQNWIQFLKNGLTVNINTGLGSIPITNLVANTTINLTDGLTIIFLNYFGHVVGDTFMLTINNVKTGNNNYDTFQWQLDNGAPTTGIDITGALQTLSLGVQISFVAKSGHTLGDYWEITVNQEVTKAWTNFYYTLPIRKPGEGYIYQLSSNFWTMAPQESQMYVNTVFGKWSYITTQLSADLQSEAVSNTPLKQASASKVIYPYMIGYLDNDLIFVTADKKLDLIGRQAFVQLPQIGNLSEPVELDFQEASFLDGSFEYQDKKLWITSPHDIVMFCYDNLPETKYWQPPQVIPENGILSVFNDQGIERLISHSFIRNQTNILFVGTDGDNGENYTVRARSPYFSNGNRWGSKSANSSFVEGYVTAAPPMVLSVIQEINGCGGIFSHPVKPVVCLSPDRAPLGGGSLGIHQNGSDRFNRDSYFKEIYQRFIPILNYYFAAIEMSCVATNHSYSWLSFGLNGIINNTNNAKYKNKAIISRQ